jgi:hypothetical protein
MFLIAFSWHDFLNLTVQISIMDNTNGTVAVKKNRKEFRRMVSAKLETCLLEFQGNVKEKKFKAAIKRAGKLLANDLYVKNKKEKKKTEEKSSPLVAETIGA